MNAKSERASLPDRVEAAARRIATGVCANCGWTRDAVLNDGRVLFVAWHHGPAGVREPKKCYECRTWSSMPALAAADACEAERNPDARLRAAIGEATHILSYADRNDEAAMKALDVLLAVSCEDVHREAAE